MEGHERGVPPIMELSLPREKQLEFARKFLELSEDIGEIVDKMWRLIGNEKFEQHPELSKEAFAIRATIFRRTCEVLKLSQQVQETAIQGSNIEDESESNPG